MTILCWMLIGSDSFMLRICGYVILCAIALLKNMSSLVYEPSISEKKRKRHIILIVLTDWFKEDQRTRVIFNTLLVALLNYPIFITRAALERTGGWILINIDGCIEIHITGQERGNWEKGEMNGCCRRTNSRIISEHSPIPGRTKETEERNGVRQRDGPEASSPSRWRTLAIIEIGSPVGNCLNVFSGNCVVLPLGKIRENSAE